MNLKKIKVISILGIFILSFISHFMYDLFPNIIFSFIFPVNESIWEHMKILYTSILLYGFIDKYLLNKYKEIYEKSHDKKYLEYINIIKRKQD